jgi:transcriptional regulator with XRE-family HTH domain
MSDYAPENLKRLMAGQGLSVDQLAQRSGLDRRTIRGLLRGKNKPHPRTLRVLAEGLGVSVDEFFVDPSRLVHRCFDRHTNPVVDEVVESHPELFAGWMEADFADLHSRVGTGGPLTEEGTLAAAEEINLRRELYEKMTLILATGQGPVVNAFFDALLQKYVLARP